MIRPYAVTMLWALTATTSLGQGPLYTNPVLPGDYPDPSVIRVGNDYWATATSSEWGPHFPILHSTDLVNWEIVGSAFFERPMWATGNFWAPEISEFNGRYFIYYVARNREGRLAVAVASSDEPAGPYVDHGQLVSQEAGSIDAMPFTDHAGKRWLVWKEDGNSRDQPTPLWLQQLLDDGLKLIGARKMILKNDAAWEGKVVEGPFILFHDGFYYLFYAGGACCGRECSYSVGVARARSVEGPWEKCPANPILTHNATWRCPGHGSVVQDPQGRYWFLYHAYATDTSVLTGREMLLDQITWNDKGWPQVGRDGPSISAPAPFKSAGRRVQLRYEDSFEADELRPGWLWPQDRKPRFEIEGGDLVLRSPNDRGKSILGAILARACTSGDYRATTVLDLREANGNALSGIAAIGDPNNAVGLAVNRERAVVWQRKEGKQQFAVDEAIEAGPTVHLRLTVSDGRQMTFDYSNDGNKWSQLGPTFDGSYMPPWDRNIRIGLTVGGASVGAARFEEFSIVDSTP